MSDIVVTIAPANITVLFPVSTPGVGVPAGGDAGQVATKLSDNDYDIVWTTPGTASTAFTMVAGENLSSGRAVISNGGLAYYFQPSQISHVGRMIGVTTTSATTSGNVQVQPVGIVSDASLSFAENKILWVGDDGAITDTIDSGWLVLQKAGSSLENDKMSIDFSITVLKS